MIGQSIFKRVFKSIRTRYSIATACFLLFVLALFYIGGRIVLIHMMHDTENRVRSVWMDVSGIVRQNTEQSCRAILLTAEKVLPTLEKDCDLLSVSKAFSDSPVSFVAECSEGTNFLNGIIRIRNQNLLLQQEDFISYASRFRAWRKTFLQNNIREGGAGIINVNRSLYCVTLVSIPNTDRVLVVGMPFELGHLSGQVTAAFSGVNVCVADNKGKRLGKSKSYSSEPLSFAVSPMISEALSFYSGGFWEINARPLDASFAIRDIAGGAVATISLSMPQTLSGVANTAVGRLGFFIAMCGIILILPIFWFQGYVLLNPLSKMTNEIMKLSKTKFGTNCPQLKWKGKDEFSLLAVSVNRMLEIISARTVELAQLESRQRALIAGVPDALVVFDKTGKLVSIYKELEGNAELPGFKIGESISDNIYNDGELSLFMTQLSLVLETGEVTSMELCARVSEKRNWRDFELRMTRMDDHFVLGIVRDVTDEYNEHRLRVVAERRVMDTSKRESLTLLAAGIAHDVNNVLSVILNTVEANSPKEHWCQAIRDAVKRGSQMTRELMTFAGEGKISLLRASPTFIVNDIKTLTAGLANRNIEIAYDLADNLPDVDVDPNQFWKVIFNIVKNAVEAIGDHHGRIVVSTEEFIMTSDESHNFIADHSYLQGRGVLFCIADDGVGIPANILNKLFDPYVSSKSTGRGLGLATVRAILEAHSGGIRVVSAAGHGTTFQIFLPESHLEKVQEINATQDTKDFSGNVLIIDNDDAVLKMSSLLMKTINVTAYLAHDRTEALAILRRQASNIGAILLDANLGAIDSVRLLETLRTVSADVRVIVTSGASEEEIRRRFADAKYDGFLAKPWTLNELKSALSIKA